MFENTAVMLDCREPRGQVSNLLTLAGKEFKGQILRHMCQSHFGFNIFLKLNLITGQVKVCLTFWMLLKNGNYMMSTLILVNWGRCDRGK